MDEFCIQLYNELKKSSPAAQFNRDSLSALMYGIKQQTRSRSGVILNIRQLQAISDDELIDIVHELKVQILDRQNITAAAVFLVLYYLFLQRGGSIIYSIFHSFAQHSHITNYIFEGDIDFLLQTMLLVKRNGGVWLPNYIFSVLMLRRKINFRILIRNGIDLDSLSSEHFQTLLYQNATKEDIFTNEVSKKLIKNLPLNKNEIKQIYNYHGITREHVESAPRLAKLLYAYVVNNEPVYLLHLEEARLFPVPDEVKALILGMRRMRNDETLSLTRVDPFLVEETLGAFQSRLY